LFGNQAIRTGIDIGSTSAKLVRGSGKSRLEQITHVGIEPYEAGTDRVTAAATALKALMSRLGLGKHKLGRLAVTVGWQEAMVQEAVTPPLGEKELVQALPFESRKHMNLEGLTEPVLDGQLLGVVTDEEDGDAALSRILFAAVSKEAREITISILAKAGLEPEILDLEPLAGLNELFANLDAAEADGRIIGLIDLGGRHAAMHVVGHDGGLLSRNLGPGSSRHDAAAE
jgi:Tfp pilus assembly PilM family ATPase